MHDSLRTHFDRALSDEPLPPPGDLAQGAMASGRRLRRQRRLLGSGGAAAAVVITGLTAVLTLNAAQDPPAGPLAAVSPAIEQTCVPVPSTTTVLLVLRDDATDRQRSALDDALRSDARIRALVYHSLEGETVDRLSDSFEVWMKEPAEFTTAFIEDMKGKPGVDHVVVGKCPK